MENQKNDNLPLLYEVRRDAFAKAERKEPDQRFFSMIHLMVELDKTVRKEGLLALEEAVDQLPPETVFRQDVHFAAEHTMNGIAPEDLTEILTSRYWAKNLQGDDALLYFMMISSFIRISLCGDITPYLLECLLLACLPDGAEEQYAAYKEQFPRKPAPAPREILLGKDDHDFGGGGFLVVKELLEEKIEQADVGVLKKVIRESGESDFPIALKGLSSPAIKSLFSVLPDSRADEYAERCAYIGPVRTSDLLASMAEMLALFEKYQKR